ncbi:15355_t:CDS:2, partial [Acaulospora colombiana]
KDTHGSQDSNLTDPSPTSAHGTEKRERHVLHKDPPAGYGAPTSEDPQAPPEETAEPTKKDSTPSMLANPFSPNSPSASSPSKVGFKDKIKGEIMMVQGKLTRDEGLKEAGEKMKKVPFTLFMGDSIKKLVITECCRRRNADGVGERPGSPQSPQKSNDRATDGHDSKAIYPFLVAYSAAGLVTASTVAWVTLKAPSASDLSLDPVSKFYALTDEGRWTILGPLIPFLIVPMIMFVDMMFRVTSLVNAGVKAQAAQR